MKISPPVLVVHKEVRLLGLLITHSGVNLPDHGREAESVDAFRHLSVKEERAKMLKSSELQARGFGGIGAKAAKEIMMSASPSESLENVSGVTASQTFNAFSMAESTLSLVHVINKEVCFSSLFLTDSSINTLENVSGVTSLQTLKAFAMDWSTTALGKSDTLQPSVLPTRRQRRLSYLIRDVAIETARTEHFKSPIANRVQVLLPNASKTASTFESTPGKSLAIFLGNPGSMDRFFSSNLQKKQECSSAVHGGREGDHDVRLSFREPGECERGHRLPDFQRFLNGRIHTLSRTTPTQAVRTSLWTAKLRPAKEPRGDFHLLPEETPCQSRRYCAAVFPIAVDCKSVGHLLAEEHPVLELPDYGAKVYVPISHKLPDYGAMVHVPISHKLPDYGAMVTSQLCLCENYLDVGIEVARNEKTVQFSSPTITGSTRPSAWIPDGTVGHMEEIEVILEARLPANSRSLPGAAAEADTCRSTKRASSFIVASSVQHSSLHSAPALQKELKYDPDPNPDPKLRIPGEMGIENRMADGALHKEHVYENADSNTAQVLHAQKGIALVVVMLLSDSQYQVHRPSMLAIWKVSPVAALPLKMNI
ncbi:hypothetical protein U0070_019820, partial [Myodes glareolus]